MILIRIKEGRGHVFSNNVFLRRDTDNFHLKNNNDNNNIIDECKQVLEGLFK